MISTVPRGRQVAINRRWKRSKNGYAKEPVSPRRVQVRWCSSFSSSRNRNASGTSSGALRNELAFPLIQPHRAADLLTRVRAEMVEILLAGSADESRSTPPRWFLLEPDAAGAGFGEIDVVGNRDVLKVQFVAPAPFDHRSRQQVADRLLLHPSRHCPVQQEAIVFRRHDVLLKIPVVCKCIPEMANLAISWRRVGTSAASSTTFPWSRPIRIAGFSPVSSIQQPIQSRLGKSRPSTGPAARATTPPGRRRVASARSRMRPVRRRCGSAGGSGCCRPVRHSPRR